VNVIYIFRGYITAYFISDRISSPRSHIGSRRYEIASRSSFHLTHISLSFTVISFTPIFMLFDLLASMNQKSLIFSTFLFTINLLHWFHTIIRILLISLSYYILVILPSHLSSMEQMLMLVLYCYTWNSYRYLNLGVEIQIVSFWMFAIPRCKDVNKYTK